MEIESECSADGGGQELDRKFGARVYAMTDGVAVVKQTIKRGNKKNAPYVIDGQKEEHVNPGDDIALGRAVRAALEGRLLK